MQDPILQWVAQRFFDRTLQPRELLSVRKGVYIGLIVLLFTVSFLWRRYAVEAQANTLSLREQNRGDVELSGSLVRLTLTGSRGLATCVLWVNAIDKQKKNQWNELEFLVRSLTKLQPHFITPWLFQSWNLAYNVSVESDRVADKYFYVVRGTQLLAEGERQNRHNPAMRYYVGFYTQHKISQSDESNVMRSLFQLSCMPPSKRDPARFRRFNENGKEEFDWIEFEAFCKENPQLVRRLRDATRKEGGISYQEQKRQQDYQFTCETANAVVAFLAANYRVPSLYEESLPTPAGAPWDRNRQDKLQKDPIERYPVLPPGKDRPTTPPQHRYEPIPGFSELDADKTLNDGTDPYAVARAWFGYAQEPLPEPDDFLPGRDKEITNRVVQRPAKMMTILFRQYPPLTQSQLAVRLQLEGWFDEEPWTIRDWFAPHGNRFADGSPARLKLPPERTAQQAWDYAAQMWQTHGERNHLLMDLATETYRREKAHAYFREDYKGPAGADVGSVPTEPPGGPESLPEPQRDRYRAARFMREYLLCVQESNFTSHYVRPRIERTPEATLARRLFYEAEGLRMQGVPDRPLEIYRKPEAMQAWLGLLLRHPEFRKDAFIQEQTYEVQLSYLLVFSRQYGQQGRGYATQGSAALSAISPLPGACLQPLALLAATTPTLTAPRRWFNAEDPRRQTFLENPHPGWLMFKGPFDVEVIDDAAAPRRLAELLSAGGEPNLATMLPAAGAVATLPTHWLITPEIVRQVKLARGLISEKKEDGPPPGMAPGPGAK